MFLFKLVILSTLAIDGWAALCPFPGLPAFGSVTNDSISWKNRRPFEEGEKLEIRCPETRWIDPTQKQTIVCQANGKWSGPMPQCSMSAGFRAILFSGNSNPLDQYTNRSFLCECGHYSVLTVTIPLMENNCGWPPIPINGDIASKFVFRQSTSANFSCHHHLIIDPKGPQHSLCNPNSGEWTELPRCFCPELPTNANIIGRTDTSIRYGCDDGYQLMGNKTITCDEPGDLSPPTCIYLNHKRTFHPLVIISVVLFIISALVTFLVFTKLRKRFTQPAGHVQSTTNHPENSNCYVGPLESNELQEPIYEELFHFSKTTEISVSQEPIYFVMEPKISLTAPPPCQCVKLPERNKVQPHHDDGQDLYSIYVEPSPPYVSQDANTFE